MSQRSVFDRRMGALLGCVLTGGALAASAAPTPAVVDSIRAEASRSLNDPIGHPLPLAGGWNGNLSGDNYSAQYQKSLIQQGHHLIPSLDMPGTGRGNEYWQWRSLAQKYAKWDIPITLKGGNWSTQLAQEPWSSLPQDQNPLLLRQDSNGNTYLDSNTPDPFGPEQPWREAGQHLIQDAPGFAKLQQWYPDPSRVILLSNNEGSRLHGSQGDESVRYLRKYGSGTSGNEQRIHIGDGYAKRFGDLIESMRGSLSPGWRDAATFVGYSSDVGFQSFPPTTYGRFGGWTGYSTANFDEAGYPADIDRSHLPWDGASPQYYAAPYTSSRDYRAWSPQVQWMNVPFEMKEVLKDNPDFWLEQSVWNGGQERIQDYLDAGQSYTTARYAGYAQYGMWLARPRLVRDFDFTEAREAFPGGFQALVADVDRVYNNPVLKRFWRNSNLVPNHSSNNPYDKNLIPEFSDANVDRWFLLDADANTNYDPNSLYSTINVYSLARVRGDPGSREWLLYAYAPLGEEDDVTITVPGYGDVVVDATVSGAFYRLNEATQQVTLLNTAVPEPASLALLGLGGGLMMLRRRRRGAPEA